MTLSDFVDRIDGPARTVSVYAPPPEPNLVERLRTETTVDGVEYRPLPAVTADEQAFLVVRESDEFVAAIDLESVREFLEPPIYDPWADALGDASYRAVVDVFETTVWTDLDRRQLLAISREIENRAWQVGSGTLRVGFQRSDALEAMAPVYGRLAAESTLNVHVYIDGDWDRPSIPDVRIHTDGGPEIGSVWFLAFDGDGDELWTSGLVAREHDSGGFEGVWVEDVWCVAMLDRAIQRSIE